MHSKIKNSELKILPQFSGKLRQGGQAIITSVVFFLFISLSLVLGVSGTAVRELRVANQAGRSAQGLYAAESGAEDFTYRMRNGLQTSASETLSVGGATTTMTVTDLPGGQKEIVSAGDAERSIRKVRTLLTVTTGTSFNYGVQVGAGGIEMDNNAGIIGNVYSNGNIVGGNGSYVTGTAIAANSAALSADQVNDAPPTPSSEVVFGNASGTQDFAESFRVSTTSALNKVQLYLKRTFPSPGNLTVRIVPDNGEVPAGSTVASAALSASLVGTSYGWVEVAFPSGVELIEGMAYWLVLDGSTSATKYYTIGANTAYGAGTGKTGQYGGAWNDTSPAGLDGYFKIYLGGQTGLVSGIEVGKNGVGNAWAHTVNNSTIAGTNYCQTGSGNNKPCNTSQGDPGPQTFPISDANVEGWKDDAAAGGTIAGDYIADDDTASLGPVHITGNLVVRNNSTLTVAGTIWVSGNVTFDNNVEVLLAPSYGSYSGVIIADGRVSVTNNSDFQGSGAEGSYMLVVTTSTCPNGPSCGGADALFVGNNAGTVILVAKNGTLRLSNNAGAKEAIGSRLELDNGAFVTYESGLADVNFSSGPGGSFSVDTWREVK
ncbi:MAG: hypothetical protein Q8Q36_01790 [bacterium]|nr:hypothetical protein [bacterium]